MAPLAPMARIALLAVMVIALDAAWWIGPEPCAAPVWPRSAITAHCTLTVHEPRRDPVADASGAHTLRLAFACAPSSARGEAPTAPRVIRGTAVVIGDPQVDGGAYALSGARVGMIAFPTVLDSGSADARGCRAAIESLLSGTTLLDGDARWRPGPPGDPLLAGPDSRVYALRNGVWWREETDGSWSRLAARDSAAARRDARLAPLERTMAERQLRDGR
jgi:hypothetical protein